MNTAKPEKDGTEDRTLAQTPAPAPAPEAGTPLQPAPKEPELPLRLAIGLIGMLFASLMAILNENVTAIALMDIRGALSIGNDDGTWVTALFEAANVATMIFAPWFGITFTLKRFAIGAVLATLLFGFLCPLSPNLLSLYVLRILQGISGGCLPPMVIIVALRYLPPRIKLYGLAGYAGTATFGPALGTPLAALWTEYVGWQVAFWQILPLGLLSCVAIYAGLPSEPLKLERFRQFNWRGLVLGYPAVSMLVIALLQADRLDWLRSPFICVLFAAGTVLLVAFLINEWFHPLPFFGLRLLARRNFTHGLMTLFCAVVLLVGIAAIPSQFLAHIHDYRPLQTTPLFLLVAAPLLISLPLTAAVLNLKWIDHRWVMAFGLCLMAATCLMGSFMESEWVRENFYWLQSLQILAQPMVIIGILMGVTTGLPPTEGPFASAMFNTVKTFSAAVATAILEGVGTAREHFHSAMLVDRLGNTPLVQHLGNNPFAGGQTIEASHGFEELARRIHEQAEVLTSADLYLVMAGFAIVFLLVIPFLPVRIYPPWSTTPPPSR